MSLKVIHLIQLLVLQSSNFCKETELVTGSAKISVSQLPQSPQGRTRSHHFAIPDLALYWMSTPSLDIEFKRILRLQDFVLCFRIRNSWLSTNKSCNMLDLFFSMRKDIYATEETSEPGGRKCCLMGTLWVKMWRKLPKAHESGTCLYKERRVLLPLFALHVTYPGH